MNILQRNILIENLKTTAIMLTAYGHVSLSTIIFGIAGILSVCNTDDDILHFSGLIDRALMSFNKRYADIPLPAPALPPHIEKFIDDLLKK
jgi:hypothetical protein